MISASSCNRLQYPALIHLCTTNKKSAASTTTGQPLGQGKLSKRSAQAIWNSCFYWFYLLLPCSRFYKASHSTEQQLRRGFTLEIWNCCVCRWNSKPCKERIYSRRLNLWTNCNIHSTPSIYSAMGTERIVWRKRLRVFLVGYLLIG